MPIDGTFADYDNPFANGVVAVFMLIGATSIVWHRMLLEGRWQRLAEHRESYWRHRCRGARVGSTMSWSSPIH